MNVVAEGKNARPPFSLVAAFREGICQRRGPALVRCPDGRGLMPAPILPFEAGIIKKMVVLIKSTILLKKVYRRTSIIIDATAEIDKMLMSICGKSRKGSCFPADY